MPRPLLRRAGRRRPWERLVRRGQNRARLVKHSAPIRTRSGGPHTAPPCRAYGSALPRIRLRPAAHAAPPDSKTSKEEFRIACKEEEGAVAVPTAADDDAAGHRNPAFEASPDWYAMLRFTDYSTFFCTMVIALHPVFAIIQSTHGNVRNNRHGGRNPNEKNPLTAAGADYGV